MDVTLTRIRPPTAKPSVARYRNVERQEEIIVFPDEDALSLIADQTWFEMLVLNTSRYRDGHEQVSRLELTRRVDEAEKLGPDKRNLLPVYVMDHGQVAYRTSPTTIRGTLANAGTSSSSVGEPTNSVFPGTRRQPTST